MLGEFQFSCVGTMSITEQSGASFIGTATVSGDGDCDPGSGAVSGTVRHDGAVTISTGDAGQYDDLETTSGCVVVQADDRLNGTFSDSELNVTAAGIFDCPSELGQFRFEIDVEMTAVRIG